VNHEDRTAAPQQRRRPRKSSRWRSTESEAGPSGSSTRMPRPEAAAWDPNASVMSMITSLPARHRPIRADRGERTTSQVNPARPVPNS
jgi:hypothetical protein